MKDVKIIKLLSDYDKLDRWEKEVFLELAREFCEEEEVLQILEKIRGKPECPRCGCSIVIKWGVESGLRRFKCKECQRTFNSLTNTPLARLKKKELWLSYSNMMLNGSSVRKAANKLLINKNTAFKWRHRFLSLISKLQGQGLSPVVEIDDFWIRKSQKGCRNLGRKPRKRGSTASNRKDN